jgi:hypothetical protein
MSPADLHDTVPLRALGGDLVVQCPHPGDQMIVDGSQGRDVHRGGERVVAALPHVHMVVGAHRNLTAQTSAE